jgi:hypothetical protein
MARRRRELAAQGSLVRKAQDQPSAPVGVVAALASSSDVRTLLPLLRHYIKLVSGGRRVHSLRHWDCVITTCFLLHQWDCAAAATAWLCATTTALRH